MNKFLSFLAALMLSFSVLAGGDDSNKGPVESLDSMTTPIVEKVVVGDNKAQTMTVEDTTVEEMTEKSMTEKKVYKNCDETFESDNFWVRSTCFLALGIGLLVL